MKIVYIAGPYSATTSAGITRNIDAARAAAREVARAGAVPLCPHTNSAGMEDIRDAQWWYDATLDLLAVCDGMVLLPGWQDSRGCVRELAYAEAAGISVVARGLTDGALLTVVEEWLRCVS